MFSSLLQQRSNSTNQVDRKVKKLLRLNGFQASFYAYKIYLAKRKNMTDMMKVRSKMGDVIK